MKRVAAWLAGFVAQPDKALHFFAWFVLVLALCAGGVSPLGALWAGLGLAWVKERWDRGRPGHTWDGWDAYAGALGSLAGASVWAWIAP